VQEAGVREDRREGQRAQHQPDGGEQAGHRAPREQRVDRLVARVADEAGGQGAVTGLGAPPDRPERGVVDEGVHGRGLGERREDRGEQGGAEDGEERRHAEGREDDQQPQRQQVERLGGRGEACGHEAPLRRCATKGPAGRGSGSSSATDEELWVRSFTRSG
jgi:hypothetical protein